MTQTSNGRLLRFADREDMVSYLVANADRVQFQLSFVSDDVLAFIKGLKDSNGAPMLELEEKDGQRGIIKNPAQISAFRGSRTVMSFRLCSRAP